MKKIILVSIISLFNSICFAQSNNTFSIKGGGGYNTLSNESFVKSSYFEKIDVFGTAIGVDLGYKIVKTPFGIFVGAMMCTYNYRHKLHALPRATFYDLRYKFKTLNIPILLRIKPDNGNGLNEATSKGIYFDVGIQFVMINKVESEAAITLDIPPVIDVSEHFQKSTMDIVLGIGYFQYSFDKMALDHGVRLTYGLSDIQKEEDYSPFETVVYSSYFDQNGYKPTSILTIEYVLTISFKLPKKILGIRM